MASANPKLESRDLGLTGLKLSCVGFGASPLGNVFGAISEDDAISSVRLAFSLGINFFDTSPSAPKTLNANLHLRLHLQNPNLHLSVYLYIDFAGIMVERSRRRFWGRRFERWELRGTSSWSRPSAGGMRRVLILARRGLRRASMRAWRGSGSITLTSCSVMTLSLEISIRWWFGEIFRVCLWIRFKFNCLWFFFSFILPQRGTSFCDLIRSHCVSSVPRVWLWIEFYVSFYMIRAICTFGLMTFWNIQWNLDLIILDQSFSMSSCRLYEYHSRHKIISPCSLLINITNIWRNARPNCSSSSLDCMVRIVWIWICEMLITWVGLVSLLLPHWGWMIGCSFFVYSVYIVLPCVRIVTDMRNACKRISVFHVTAQPLHWGAP